MTAVARVIINPVGTSVKSFVLDVDKITGLIEYKDKSVVIAYRRFENAPVTKLEISNSFDEVAHSAKQGLSRRMIVSVVDGLVERILVNVDKVVGLVEHHYSPYVKLTYRLFDDEMSPTQTVYSSDKFLELAKEVV